MSAIDDPRKLNRRPVVCFVSFAEAYIRCTVVIRLELAQYIRFSVGFVGISFPFAGYLCVTGSKKYLLASKHRDL